MARWTQTWLGGPSAAGVRPRDPDRPVGGRLGLPATGEGSVAAFGARAGAFAVDALLSGLVGRLFVPAHRTAGLALSVPGTVALALVYLVGLFLVGQTIGMRLLKLRVVQLPAQPGGVAGTPTLLAVALRTALLLLLVPALITDRDGRGLHDRAARTVVVRA